VVSQEQLIEMNEDKTSDGILELDNTKIILFLAKVHVREE